jgi:hypothetical protein
MNVYVKKMYGIYALLDFTAFFRETFGVDSLVSLGLAVFF